MSVVFPAPLRPIIMDTLGAKLYIEMVETQEIVYREFLIQHKISCFWSTIANIEIKN